MNFCSLCPDKTTYLDIPYIKLKLWTSVIHWYTAFKNLRNYGRDGWLYDSLAPPLVYLLHSILQMDLITLFWRPIAFKQAQGFDGMNNSPTALQDVCNMLSSPFEIHCVLFYNLCPHLENINLASSNEYRKFTNVSAFTYRKYFSKHGFILNFRCL